MALKKVQIVHRTEVVKNGCVQVRTKIHIHTAAVVAAYKAFAQGV